MHRFMVALGALVISSALALPARAQQEGAASGPAVGALHCRRVHCECATAPFATDDGLVFRPQESQGCRQVVCHCLDDDTSAEPASTLPEPEPPTEIFTAEPAPVSGFTLARRRVGIKLDLGFPFLDAQIAYGAHDAVEIGAGYRGMYGMSNGGYGSLRFRLYHNDQPSASVSLAALGGYIHVRAGEGHDERTTYSAGDSGYIELNLSASVGRGRHWFTAATGVRIAWIQDHAPCREDDWGYSYCYDTLFPDGQGRVMPVVFLELGYAVRLWRFVSFFIATGFDAFTNSRAYPASVRQRLGLLFDF